jgi:antitoxin PrlF
MPTATVRNEGQITIPREVREALGLTAGHRVAFQIREDGVVEMRPDTVDLMALYGIVKPSVKGVTLADMDEAIRRGATKG